MIGQKIRCANPDCQKVIAVGQLPAKIEIKCDSCKAFNNLNGPIVRFSEKPQPDGSNSIPYGERRTHFKK